MSPGTQNALSFGFWCGFATGCLAGVVVTASVLPLPGIAVGVAMALVNARRERRRLLRERIG